MDKDAKIYVAGHNGMVGSAILRKLKREGYTKIIGRTRTEMDLTHKEEVDAFFEKERPEYVFFAAAKVGGIKANSTYPVEFGVENVTMTCNVLQAAHNVKVKKLLYLGSACTYPNSVPVPVKEQDLLAGAPEETNEAYALAKNFGVRLCSYYKREYDDNFIAVTPANCYGENDSFDPQNSHVIPALIQKCYLAKRGCADKIEVWGSGKACREFIYVDDLADACVFLMENYLGDGHINIGSGSEIPISELVELVSRIVGYDGKIIYDVSKPDGKTRNAIDSSKLFQMGWKPKFSIEEGIKKLYLWYLKKYENIH